ncbi:MAG: hypothetical protein GY915_07210 [bacterium]|nr:hypothetical protein [bacterium]
MPRNEKISRAEIKEKLYETWRTEPKWPTGNNKISETIKTLKDEGQFTVVVPYRVRAYWWRDIDVIDRMIDLPIPIPSSKQDINIACKLGTRTQARKFRESLKDTKHLDLAEGAFIFPGRYPRFARQQYITLLQKLFRLKSWDEVVGKTRDIP